MEWEERKAEIIGSWEGGSDDLELKLQNEYNSFFNPYHHTGETVSCNGNSKPYEQEPACIVVE
jgi:hypothetical protein